MVWRKDENGNWGNFYDPPEEEQAPPAAAGMPPIDDVSYDGTHMTSATMEEVYNSRNGTVEQKLVRGGKSKENADVYQSNAPIHGDDEEGDSRSMSSMSNMFREARGDRHRSNAPSDYANYQYDDEATVDSLADIFSKKTETDKQAQKSKLVQKWANNKARAKSIPREKKKPEPKAKDDSLDGIIGDAAGLHDQEQPHQIDDILDDILGPEEPAEKIADIPAPEEPKKRGFKFLSRRSSAEPEIPKESKKSFVDVPIGSPEENDKQEEEEEEDPKDIAANPTAELSFESDEPDVRSAMTSSTSSSVRRKRKKEKRSASNKRMCCWIFGIIMLIALALVVFFQVYYWMERQNSAPVSGSINGSDDIANDNATNIDENTIDENTIDESVIDIDVDVDVDAMDTQPQPPTVPVASPTVSRTNYPTESPTKDYINPLMEFLQDNQVFFERDPLSPDFMAVQWLADEAQFRSTNGVSSPYGNGLEFTEKIIQRFALLTLDYSLSRPNATVAAALKLKRQNLAQSAMDYSASDYETFERRHTIAKKEIDECSWEGVICASVGSKAGQVEEIDFSYSGLTGTIPPEIKLLQNLKKLDLAGNELHGSIPSSLYNIRELEELYLYKNHLTGTISNDITNWWNMTRLHLSHNELSGSIPLTFMSGVAIRPIQYLNLYSNQLTGTIPDLRFRKLKFIDLGRNKFSGTLPEDIGLRWVELRFLYLDHNQFTGTIPYDYPTVGNSRVEAMTLNHNRLTGYVPGHFQLNKLLEFSVHNNTFTGIDSKACKQSVFDSGEMVEYKADCDICSCDPYCSLKCGDDKGKWK